MTVIAVALLALAVLATQLALRSWLAAVPEGHWTCFYVYRCCHEDAPVLPSLIAFGTTLVACSAVPWLVVPGDLRALYGAALVVSVCASVVQHRAARRRLPVPVAPGADRDERARRVREELARRAAGRAAAQTRTVTAGRGLAGGSTSSSSTSAAETTICGSGTPTTSSSRSS